jgi:cbb3-type cytochrome oxidase subunit 3
MPLYLTKPSFSAGFPDSAAFSGFAEPLGVCKRKMSTWETILLGMVVLLVILWFRPGIRAAFQHAEQVEEKDWRGFLLPLALVVLFVLLLLAMV